MQIVIDIPDTFYQAIKSDKYGVHQGRIYDIIRNGTPLSKGHGRLIDADELESRMKIGYCIVRNAPTIIEADKASEGDENGSN